MFRLWWMDGTVLTLAGPERFAYKSDAVAYGVIAYGVKATVVPLSMRIVVDYAA
jgi:hypothetical protein